ncbi:hypothetical protein [Streptomyces sp. NBC_00151]|uniref:hypothetical protein n=1 Tax=Streptomyces sp. NBC_00151 TaxID=2975669 RepID=UPI002DDC1E6D|nr:hypothetical protein [Streptomyces sp. NBC_00151]WRZ40411.1 hypothetical protein OG915_21580 [Streptomyces sp. NBC_00151]
MNPNEIQMLIVGAALGAQLMNLLHMRWDAQAARRSAAASKVARKQASGDLFLSSLRLYRLQNRSRA